MIEGEVEAAGRLPQPHHRDIRRRCLSSSTRSRADHCPLDSDDSGEQWGAVAQQVGLAGAALRASGSTDHGGAFVGCVVVLLSTRFDSDLDRCLAVGLQYSNLKGGVCKGKE